MVQVILIPIHHQIIQGNLQTDPRSNSQVHVGIVEEHIMHESAQRGKEKGLARKARYEVLMNSGQQQTLG